MNIVTDEADVVSRVVRWADTDDRIRVALLTSSRANPHALMDMLSDYDVALIVSDADHYANSATWVCGFGNPLLRVRDTERMFGMDKHNDMVLYADGTKVDYSIWPLDVLHRIRERERLPDEFDVGYRILLDRDAVTSGWPPATYTAHIPSKPAQQEFQSLIEEFWWVTTYVAKFLWRHEPVTVKALLDQELKFLVMRRLLEWHIEVEHDWTIKPGFFGRGLHKQLDTDTWERYAATYIGTDPDDNWAALFETIELFRRIAIDVADALGYDYPHDTDAQVTSYLRQIKSLAASTNE